MEDMSLSCSLSVRGNGGTEGEKSLPKVTEPRSFSAPPRGLPGGPELLIGQPEWKQCLEQEMLGHHDKGPKALPDLGSGATAESGRSVVGEGTG